MKEKTVEISADIICAEAQALADFHRNRALIASQRLLDATAQIEELQKTLEEERAILAANTAPSDEEDRNFALASLLSNFVAEEAFGEAAYARLLADAKRVLANY